MSLELKKRIKQRNITVKSIFNVFKYSFNGLRCYAKDGKSVILYIICCMAEVIVALLVGISPIEWIILIFMMLATLSMELMNTALEAICDLVCKEYNDFIKLSKDCASAATFVLSSATLILSLVMYIPKII